MRYTTHALLFLVVTSLLGVAAAADDASARRPDADNDVALAEDAGERGTPPWTNDSANINNKQPRTPPRSDLPTYSEGDFEVKEQWQERFADPDHIAGASGEAVYANLCQACHMPDGKGAEGAGMYPALVDDGMLAAAAYPITVIVHGLRGMPSFAVMLTDEQIAAVVNYLRSEFNDFDADVSAADVAAIRNPN
ncbi:MAG TPA: cytochrome c [Salinisphaeraceae bacterium]|nr:cytochrome c [Salinisphaeraceae bacterium]